MSTAAMFLVLSDLHFGADLFEAPQMARLSLSRKLQIVTDDNAVSEFFVRQCKGHDVTCIKKLRFYLNVLLAQEQRDEFDLCILVGDQATIPDSRAYSFLCKYLTEDEYTTSDGYIQYRCSGLGFRREQIIAIPGNHDKLLLTNLDFYNLHFTRALELPEELEPQKSAIAIRNVGSRELVLVLVDASRYAARSLHLDGSARDHLAAGEITEGLRTDIAEKLRALKKGRPTGSAGLSGPYGAACKLLVIHYPVDYKRFKDAKWHGRFLAHDCAGLPELVEELRTEFQLNIVLHGHLHEPLLYNHDGVQVISATTSSQSGGRIGFYVIKVSETGQISTEHHSWNDTAFVADPPAAGLSRLITEFPLSDVA